MIGKITTRKKLYEENKKYWESENYDKRDGYICIGHAIPYHLTHSMALDLTAKGIQQREHLPVMGFSVGLISDSFQEGDESFGYIGRNYDIENDYIRRFDKEETLQTIVDKCYGKKEEIINLKYRGINCGDSLWETLVVNSDQFDCSRVDKNIFIHIVKKVLVTVDLAYEIFEQYPPKYFLLEEGVRLLGLYAAVAAKLGAKIIIPRIDAANYPIIFKSDSFKLEGIVAKEYNLRMKYVKNKNIDMVPSKYVFELDGERSIPLNLEKNKKLNAFIMVHQFKDATRAACEHSIYRDYLEWFLDTMEIIKDIPNVNWIIRDHPMGEESNQRKIVRDTFLKYKCDHIQWCEPSVARECITKEADVIITYCGDVGLEYWAKGKPTIVLGNAYYADQGISYQMKSREEYIETLRNLDKLETPKDESIRNAKNIIERSPNVISQSDELATLLNKIRKKELAGTVYGNRYVIQNYDLYEYEFIKGYLDLLQRDKVRTSECILLNNLIEE